MKIVSQIFMLLLNSIRNSLIPNFKRKKSVSELKNYKNFEIDAIRDNETILK